MKCLFLIIALCLPMFYGCSKPTEKPVKQGDLSKKGGSATLRRVHERKRDDPATTNDETNDQPVGYYGKVTVRVTNMQSGNSYNLDADTEDGTTDDIAVNRIYFPKGGWVDFYACDIDSEFEGFCIDENGDSWRFLGKR